MKRNDNFVAVIPLKKVIVCNRMPLLRIIINKNMEIFMKTNKSIITKSLLIPFFLLAQSFTSSAFAVEPTSLPPIGNPKGMERCCDDERNTLNKQKTTKSSRKSSMKTKSKSKSNPKGMERCCDDEKNPAMKTKR